MFSSSSIAVVLVLLRGYAQTRNEIVYSVLLVISNILLNFLKPDTYFVY